MTNDKGTFAVLKVEPHGPTPPDVYQQARKLRASITSDTVRVIDAEDGAPLGEPPSDLPY